LGAALAACCRAGNATPEQAALYRARQFGAVAEQLLTAAVGTLLVLMLALLVFWRQAHQPLLTMLSVALLLACLGGIGVWMHWRQRPAQQPMSRRACWLLGAYLGLAAALDALVALHCFAISTPEQRLFVVALAAAFIATGGWMLSPLPHAGIAWSLGYCLIAALGLVITQGPQYTALAALLLLYAVALCASTLVTSRLFLNHLVARQKLEQQNQLVGLLLNDFENNASDWLWETDAQGRLRHVSQRLAQLLGRPGPALHGQPLAQLLAHMCPDDEGAIRMHQQLAALLAQAAPFRGLVLPVLLGGQRRWWSLTAKPLPADPFHGAGWRGVGSDITKLHSQGLELTRLATRDSLTGLANRHHFNQRLANLSTAPLALFMFDLDNFKHVNDSLGHAAGDELLCEVAQRLSAGLRPQDLLARLGGDEFALLLPGITEREAATQLGQRLQAALSQPCTVQDHRVDIHASIGVAFAPADAADAAALLKAADLALYEAKAAGRRTLRFFEAHMESSARHRADLLADLREALRLNQLVLHYQPQVDLASGALQGFEALVRWLHPTRGMVSPAQFIPLAEDSGLIVPLGRWVLERACADAATWPAHLSVAVNISAVEFERADLRHNVQEALAASGLPAARLELELTESTLLQDTEAAVKLLRDLRALGVRVALDDFGTGFSSLAYLRSFPLDKLKIDRAFIKTLDSADGDPAPSAIVRSIHGLAQALGLQVTAEGVETQAQQQVLQQIGCAQGQGYLFAKPLSSAQTQAFIGHTLAHGLVTASQRAQGEVLNDKPPVNLPREAGRIASARVVMADSRWAAL
jgi:diguanylate cyclase (GGDEF)-like protein